MNTQETVYSEEHEAYVLRKPSANLTAEELVNETSKWLPWLKCPLLRLAAARGYRAHPDQRDVKEARWERYVSAMRAIGLPEELALRFRNGPNTPEGALRGLRHTWAWEREKEANVLHDDHRLEAKKDRMARFKKLPLAAKFPTFALSERGYFVWPGSLTGRGHAPRVSAGGGLSYGKRPSCESTRRRAALSSLGLVETQEWRDSGARGESSRAWTYEWTLKLTLEDLEAAAAILV